MEWTRAVQEWNGRIGAEYWSGRNGTVEDRLGLDGKGLEGFGRNGKVEDRLGADGKGMEGFGRKGIGAYNPRGLVRLIVTR